MHSGAEVYYVGVIFIGAGFFRCICEDMQGASSVSARVESVIIGAWQRQRNSVEIWIGQVYCGFYSKRERPYDCVGRIFYYSFWKFKLNICVFFKIKYAECQRGRRRICNFFL